MLGGKNIEEGFGIAYRVIQVCYYQVLKCIQNARAKIKIKTSLIRFSYSKKNGNLIPCSTGIAEVMCLYLNIELDVKTLELEPVLQILQYSNI